MLHALGGRKGRVYQPSALYQHSSGGCAAGLKLEEVMNSVDNMEELTSNRFGYPVSALLSRCI